jgi:hypothetical protein
VPPLDGQFTGAAATGLEQAPLDVLQVPATWQASAAVHTTGFEPVHTPFWQVSVRVHALLSLQVVPLPATGFVQAPVPAVHVPAV